MDLFILFLFLNFTNFILYYSYHIYILYKQINIILYFCNFLLREKAIAIIFPRSGYISQNVLNHLFTFLKIFTMNLNLIQSEALASHV